MTGGTGNTRGINVIDVCRAIITTGCRWIAVTGITSETGDSPVSAGVICEVTGRGAAAINVVTDRRSQNRYLVSRAEIMINLARRP